ncbi:low-density lipoprotein receptor-related protein 2-like [Dendronephthya gigantea]|uniref:low-density lipoprotein receptor-related protein 2-like n=1 Tax=Dendronephthya gigantea TaxID=151771 RepID=UPI00106C8FAC|nr:low-density lipoprotein receptor-related protein 2-like [Dendronephthya gigantea]
MSTLSSYHRLHIPVLIIFNIKMFILQAYEHKCYSLFDCDGRVCCAVSFNPLIKVCSNKSSNCVGMACLKDRDCPGYRECCDNKVCTNDVEICGCKYVRDHVCRDDDKVCCIPHLSLSKEKRLCKHKCEYHPCSADYECGKDECCNRNICSSNCTRLRECGVESDCSNASKCCESNEMSGKKACMPKCTYKQCVTDGDCAELSLCCGDEKLCKKCRNSSHSLTKFIIISCVLLFVIICSLLVLTVCCTRRGRCVLFKPRSHEEETFELHSETVAENDAPNENLPPPPYSILNQPFPASQNQEFPPLYRAQGT